MSDPNSPDEQPKRRFPDYKSDSQGSMNVPIGGQAPMVDSDDYYPFDTMWDSTEPTSNDGTTPDEPKESK